MRRVAVINQKGGVGKTTTTVNHGAALTRLGKRVLLIDIDPQANLTLHVDRRPGPDTKTLTNLFVDDVPLREMIQETATPGLCVVPADTSLAGVEQVLANRIGREMILSEALDSIEDLGFDFVLIDCPPSLGVLSANALVGANEVIIPLQTEYFALQGMAKLMEVIDLVKKRLNPALGVNCVLPCMVDQRTNLSSEVLSELANHFGDLVAGTMIRMNVKLAEAPSFGRTVFEHDPECNGAWDHETFAREFLGLPFQQFEDEEEEEDEEEPEEGDELEEYELDAEDEEEEEQDEEEEEAIELVVTDTDVVELQPADATAAAATEPPAAEADPSDSQSDAEPSTALVKYEKPLDAARWAAKLEHGASSLAAVEE